MPCENCNVQFTVFRRKKSCGDCKRFYCSNCLLVSKKNVHIFLCERCTIFSKRPLLHSDLNQLKPKDLIFFLQSKHISTTGCVEKEELIRLVLNHVNQTEGCSNTNTNFGNGQCHQNSSSTAQTDASGNSFDNIRQTCQNFFFNITENISDSLAAFDNKNSGKSQQSNGNRNGNRNSGRDRRGSSGHASTTHIFDQPRVSRREIPTYASSLNATTTVTGTPLSPPSSSNATTTTTILIDERPMQIPSTSSRTTINRDYGNANGSPTSSSSSASSTTATTTTASANHSIADEQKTSASSSLGSPIVSISSIASQSHAAQEAREQQQPILNLPPKLSDCECSDDDDDAELIDTYTKRNSLTTARNEHEASNAQIRLETEQQQTNRNSPASRLAVRELDDGTSHSSFEELGAIGCSASVVSDNSKTTDSNAEAWQILENQNEPTTTRETTVTATTTSTTITNCDADENTAESTLQTVISTEETVPAPPPPRKKLLRRRSERQRSVGNGDDCGDQEESPTSTMVHAQQNAGGSIENDLMELELEHVNLRRRSGTCRRCGKNNLRRYVQRMRQHLESSQMSEADIKREMHDFLAFLEEQTRSVDFSETETTASPLPNEPASATANASSSQVSTTPNINFRDSAATSYMEYANDNDGIHVYAAEASPFFTEHNSRFVNLDDFDSVEDLESLTVKQLKEVLMLHRVDYKGCCEKQELLERVERLWKNLKSTPAIEKLPTDELCKICMDAPIECVILECGHMATCTNCGKVLSECPICRQYIVRVVRFFRA